MFLAAAPRDPRTARAGPRAERPRSCSLRIELPEAGRNANSTETRSVEIDPESRTRRIGGSERDASRRGGSRNRGRGSMAAGRVGRRMMSDSVILEVASNGVTSRAQNPAVPREPAGSAADALACFAAGAAVVHTHTHEPALPPRQGADLYLAAYRPVLAERPDALLYPTVAPGRTIEERYGHTALLAEARAIRFGVFDTGSVNLGAAAADGWPLAMDFVYTNSPNDIRHMAAVCLAHGLGPSVAVFEPGFLRVVLAAERAGVLPPGTLVKLYFSAGGYLGSGEPIFGAPPIREALEMYLAMLRGSRLPWAVAVIGGSLLASEIAPLAVARGGHLRVGLEDHFTAKSNVDEVRRAAALCAEHGRPLASCAETEQILGIPARA